MKESYMKWSLETKYLVLIVFSGVIGIGVGVLGSIKDHYTALSRGPTATVLKQDLVQSVTLAGTIIPARKAVITAPYDGYIRKIYKKVFDQVKKGDPIVNLTQSLSGPIRDTYPLRAPFPGTIVQVLKGEGEFVEQANKDKNAIVRIDDLSKLFVLVDVAETEIPKIRVGQTGIVKVVPLSNRNFKGKVVETALAAKEKTGGGPTVENAQFTAKIEILNKAEEIRPGMTALVDISTYKKQNVLVLPHEFVQVRNGKHVVFMTDGRTNRVTLGAENDDLVEITSGLKEGDKVRLLDFTSSGYGNRK
jgi:multidrug efflux pump subunit AcrA (membrane-fusion protein)